MFIEKIIKFISVIIIFLLLAYAALLSLDFFVWSDVYEEVYLEEKTITVINSKSGEETQITYERQGLKGEPYVALLLGVDSEDISQGRSDTILLAVVEPKNNKISLLSIPRDSYIPNAGTGKQDKVNHSYNQGPANTISTLESYFNIPIDYYASINFDGFEEAIDEIGGLTIDVEKDLRFYDRITHTNFTLEKGEQKLSGIEALNYARYRGDGEGDFGRNRRQQQVISALITQGTEFQNVNKISGLIGILQDNFRTNVKSVDIGVLLKQLNFGSGLYITSIPLEAKPGRAGKMSIVVIDENERQRVINELHEKLGFIESQNE